MLVGLVVQRQGGYDNSIEMNVNARCDYTIQIQIPNAALTTFIAEAFQAIVAYSYDFKIVFELKWDKQSDPLLTHDGRQEAYNSLPKNIGTTILTNLKQDALPEARVWVQTKIEDYQTQFFNASDYAAKNAILVEMSKFYQVVNGIALEQFVLPVLSSKPEPITIKIGSKELKSKELTSEAYRQTVTPYYRSEAATIIQKAFRIRKEAKDGAKFTGKEEKIVWKDHLQVLRMKKLREPARDEAFNRALLKNIKNYRYDLIDFAHENFTRHLFGALRAGLITQNELMTTKLMYDSLICFNKGKMPEKPAEHFGRYSLQDRGPYNPYRISYWHQRESSKMSHLQYSEYKKLHYYTINLPRHQVAALLYDKLRIAPDDTRTIPMLEDFFCVREEDDIKKEAFVCLDKFKETPNNEHANELRNCIERYEPDTIPFLRHWYNDWDLKTTLGLSFDEYRKDRDSVFFLVKIDKINSQIPTLCKSPDYNASNPNSPIISFVLPTIDTLNILQEVVHEAETALPTPVIGQETPQMIRAYDEIPKKMKGADVWSTLKTRLQSLFEKTPKPEKRLLHEQSELLLATLSPQEKLALSYPTAQNLETNSRPVELTHPDAQHTKKSHGCICHDFLLSWHDVFHAWVNGSNYKDIIRTLRTLHDEKAGFAKKNDPKMPKAVWALTDMDLQIGIIMRQTSGLSYERDIAALLGFLKLMETAGFTFTESTDDNNLLLYHFFQSPQLWISGYNNFYLLDENDNAVKNFLKAHFTKQYNQYNQLAQQYKKMNWYLQHHSEASVVEVILHELLTPKEEGDDILLQQLDEAVLKEIFYWAGNKGLHFQKKFREDLKKLNVAPRLRDNDSKTIRAALKYCFNKIHAASLTTCPHLDIDSGLIPQPCTISINVTQTDASTNNQERKRTFLENNHYGIFRNPKLNGEEDDNDNQTQQMKKSKR